MADLPGISFIRTTREKTPAVYGAGEDFPSAARRRCGPRTPTVTLVGAGITVHEALGAARALEADGIAARVLDCYTIKPIDAEALRTASSETGLVVTIEDHWIEGGLGDAVLAALAATATSREGSSRSRSRRCRARGRRRSFATGLGSRRTRSPTGSERCVA